MAGNTSVYVTLSNSLRQSGGTWTCRLFWESSAILIASTRSTNWLVLNTWCQKTANEFLYFKYKGSLSVISFPSMSKGLVAERMFNSALVAASCSLGSVQLFALTFTNSSGGTEFLFHSFDLSDEVRHRQGKKLFGNGNSVPNRIKMQDVSWVTTCTCHNSVVSHNLEVSQEGCVFSLSDERDNQQLGWSTEQQGVPWVCLQLQPNTCYNTSTVSGVVATLMKRR